VVHSKTPNPAEVTRNADIVIAAVGVPELVRGDWLKPGAVVIDVGINPVEVCCMFFSLTVYRSLRRNLN
jgi:5,10-methylene-tetrahydrofolate dehydrogenase/methenyl tetrahydrofolate cyclohydrolase